MPEGHVLHRLAGQFTEHFVGRDVAVSSPQGRFADEAAALDGRTLTAAEAWGKHLFVGFAGEDWVHIHLGLIGTLRFGPPAPVQGVVRVRFETAQQMAELRGPQTCALINESRMRQQIARLGPDPLRPDADPELAWHKIKNSGRSVASLLIDQAVIAGPGSIYRSEVLFRQGIDPLLPGQQLPRTVWQRVWDDLVSLMHDGVVQGRIDTVRDEHMPDAMGRPPRVDDHGGEVYVYRRTGQPCHVCSTPVAATPVEGRQCYWCPRCQRNGRTGVRR